MGEFHLSVVAASRNDDHGGQLLCRMQYFVDGFISQCKRHGLKGELILVEWNPPENKPFLSEVLKISKDQSNCAIRIIQVAKNQHDKFENAENIPLFQMIAKNAGVRRARGKFILATNIDILFSDHLVRYMCNHLQKGCLYRADRLDVPTDLPANVSFENLLDFCHENYFRINGKRGTLIKKSNKWIKEKSLQISQGAGQSRKPLIRDLIRKIYYRFLFNIHGNAPGDFTLMSSSDWKDLRGYPEWPIFSWHIDRLFLYQAQLCGIKSVDLDRKKILFHIEHARGSGYTPGDSNALFHRLKQSKISYLNDFDVLNTVHEMRMKIKQKERPIFNSEDWGLAQMQLEEIFL